MNIEVKNQTAIVREPGVLITDGSSAMELLATALAWLERAGA